MVIALDIFLDRAAAVADAAPMRPRMSGFIGLSLDGFIARADGDIDWLTGGDDEAIGDSGYEPFFAQIDTLAVGRGTYDVVAGFDEWPWADRPVVVLSTTLGPDADPRVTVVRDLAALFAHLEASGARHVYADGGRVLQGLLAAGLLDDITLTRLPILIGTGISLFGPLPADVVLTHEATTVLGGGAVQSRYRVAGAADGPGAHAG